jgi:dihydrofolate reductase
MLGFSTLFDENCDMRIVAVAVCSSDGFITRGQETDVSLWTSAEDKAFFASIRTKYRLFVMGSGTYRAVKPKPSHETLRIVLTTKPHAFCDVESSGELEFHNLTPNQFSESFDGAFKDCLILGGKQVYSDFLSKNLIDDFFLVVEPITHRSGTRMLEDGLRLSTFLTLTSSKKLNQRGTTLEHWSKKR